MDTRGAVRDWNEEYQSCRELPSSTPAEKTLRDRTLYRVYTDFTVSAVKGATAVVQGNIFPLNPADEERNHVYLYNNIFFR